MAVTQIHLEAHDLDSRTGLLCVRCLNWSVTEVDVAIVTADTLQLVRRSTGSECLACGAEDG